MEGWGPLDAIYFLTATVTTVGYGDFCPSSGLSQLFTIAYAPVGAIIILQASITLIAPSITWLNSVTKPWLKHIGMSSAASEASLSSGTTLSSAWWQSARVHPYVAVLPGPLLSLLIIALVAVLVMGENVLSGTYFAVITMTTIGFGDISPTEWPGKVCLVLLMPLSTAALALAVKDASKIATRDSICHANFKLQLQQMLLREAQGDPDKRLSKAAFLLAVLKEYGLVDSQTLQTIDQQYERLISVDLGGGVGSSFKQSASEVIDCRVVYEHLVKQRRVRHKADVTLRTEPPTLDKSPSTLDKLAPSRAPSELGALAKFGHLSRSSMRNISAMLTKEASSNHLEYQALGDAVFGASVHYQTVDMSAPDRGFDEWYDSYWVPAVRAESNAHTNSRKSYRLADGGKMSA